MSIFREYDIRGIVGKDLTVELAEKIGRSYGSRAVRAGAKAIAVGRDGRTSAPVMLEAVLKGLLGCGLDVVDIGICPTPLLYFALFTLPVGGGVMITASHNPPEYNGFKVVSGASTIHGEQIQEVRELIDNRNGFTDRGTRGSDLVAIQAVKLTKYMERKLAGVAGKTLRRNLRTEQVGPLDRHKLTARGGTGRAAMEQVEEPHLLVEGRARSLVALEV